LAVLVVHQKFTLREYKILKITTAQLKFMFTQNKVIKNSSWIIGERILQMLISLIISMLIARYLGPTNYGILTYTSSFIALFATLCQLGLENVIIKQLVENPGQEGYVLGTGIAMRLLASIISIFAIQMLIIVLNDNNELILLVAALQSISLIFRSFDLIDYWYQSKLQSKYVSIIKIIAYSVVSVYKVILLILGKTVEWFAFSNSLEVIVIGLLLMHLYSKTGGKKFNLSLRIARDLLAESKHFIIAGIISMVYSQLDKIMIGNILDIKSVGLYSVAITLCSLWSFIPSALIQSARPIIMESKIKDELTYLKRLKQLYAVIIWIGFLYAAFITIFGRYLVTILYGSEYIGAVPALVIVVWYSSFSLIGSARGIWMICEGLSKYISMIFLVGAICNIVLNVLLIPLWGIEGAATAALVTQIISCLVAPLFFKKTRIHTRYVIEAFLLKGLS
jgi:O-antigen/teichoic acid export membrane protein